MRNDVWTEATTQSSSASRSSVVVERAVGVDVHLRAGEQPEARRALVQLAHSLDLRAAARRPDVVAEAVRGGVVGDREVLVAARLRRLGHLLERVAPVGERRVASAGRPAGRRRSTSSGSVAFERRLAARRGPRAAPARCRRGRALVDLLLGGDSGAVLPVSSSSTPYSLTCSPRRTAYSRSSTLCCLEPVRCWSRLPNWSGATTRRSMRRPLWVTPRAPASPLDPDLGEQLHLGERLRQRGRVVGGRDDVEVLAGVGHAPRAAGDLDPVG